jgi:hypothetical protein
MGIPKNTNGTGLPPKRKAPITTNEGFSYALIYALGQLNSNYYNHFKITKVAVARAPQPEGPPGVLLT